MEKEQYEKTCEKLGLRKVENETFAIGPFTFDLLPDGTVFVKYTSEISSIGDDFVSAVSRLMGYSSIVVESFDAESEAMLSHIVKEK